MLHLAAAFDPQRSGLVPQTFLLVKPVGLSTDSHFAGRETLLAFERRLFHIEQMGLLQLDPDSSFRRWQDAEPRPSVRSFGESVIRGTIGFTALSLGVFATWAFGGRFLYGNFGELGAYVVWCLLFLLGAGLMRPCLTGPISWGRFYGLFLSAFFSYSVAWTIAWMALHNRMGEWLGAFFGMLAMAAVMGWILGAPQAILKSLAVLFVGNAAGYFLGSWCHANTGAPWAQLLWGLFYGLGTGAGMGTAFYFCQERLRHLIDNAAAAPGEAAEEPAAN